jgi:SHS2 domain-containing protein
MGSFHFVDDVAIVDRAIDVTAGNLTDTFETAARALAEATVNPATVPESIARHVVLDAETCEHLLFDWLSELIDLRERDGEVYVRTVVRVSESGPCHLAARLYGGRIAPGRTERRADVKGVSPRAFALEACEKGWHARFVVDV